MTSGNERIERIRGALQNVGLDALICVLPSDVLLLSGYWPVVGTAVAVATRDGRVAVLAPEDEQELSAHSWATEVRTYSPGSLNSLSGPTDAVREPLGELLRHVGVERGRLGYETRSIFEESTYAAAYTLQANIHQILMGIAPHAQITPGDDAIAQLRSALTTQEVSRVRLACEIGSAAYVTATRSLRPGRHEAEVAAAYEMPMVIDGLAHAGVERAAASVYCMSGPNSALAGAAYARTRNRELQGGDFVLVHCNSTIDGYWTDITRTYCLGEPDARQRAIYDAVFEAREAALAAICPGAAAADVDRAARDVLTQHGFGEYFTHGVGHNMGFSAISPDFPPRLHPASPDHLDVGMTFNIEPSVYIKGYGGVRHCDVVTVHEHGPEVLTPFQSSLEEMIVDNGATRAFNPAHGN